MTGLRRRIVVVATAAVAPWATLCAAPQAAAVPGPEVEYVYNVMVRRHFEFPNNDALAYGFGICDKVTRGVGYADVVSDVRRDVLPADERAANYLVSNAMTLCPAQIWSLRNSAAGYRPPA